MHYTPLDVETFVPLTRNNIQQDANCHWRMLGVEIHELLETARNGEPGEFDGNVVRLKAVFDSGEVFYMDRDGTLMWSLEDGTTQLSPSDRKLIDERLRKLAAAHGCKYS